MATFKQKVSDYRDKYGNIPEEYEERFKLLLSLLKFKPKETEHIKKLYTKLMKRETETMRFELYMMPEPCPRPRTTFNTRRFYVMGAADNNALFKDIVKTIGELPIITTACRVNSWSYLPTPSAMNRYEKFFAELGLLRVTVDPDWDNLAKAFCDMIQKNLILNDSLIFKGMSEKRYSMKPRIEIEIEYDLEYDCTYNKKKIINSKSYQDVDRSRIDDMIEAIVKLK